MRDAALSREACLSADWVAPWWVRIVPPLHEAWRHWHYLRVLKSRDKATVDAEWDEYGLPVAFVTNVSAVVARVYKWPSSLFSVFDDCEVLLFPWGDINLEYVDFAQTIQKQWGLSDAEWASLEALIVDKRACYGTFVANLYQIAHRHRGTDERH